MFSRFGKKELRNYFRLAALLTILTVTPAAGATAPTPVPTETSFTVLCYHRFLVKPDEKGDWAQTQYQMPLEEFKWQMQYLKDNGFTPISVQQLKEYWFQGKPLPLKPVLISFDDGFRTVYTDAYPVIQQFHFPSVFFIYTKFIEYGENAAKRISEGKEKQHIVKKKIAALTVDDFKQMEKGGMDLEAHTANHLNLGLEAEKQTAEAFEKTLRFELTEPVTFLQTRFNLKPDLLAYPYGVYNPQILEETAKAGYTLAFTVNPGPNDRTVPPLKLKRNLILYPIKREAFIAIFEPKVLHLGNFGPGDGEVIDSDKPLISVEIKDNIDPKTISFELGNQPMRFQYDPKLHLLTHRIGAALKAGGHMITLGATDLQGQKRVYTWYFRVKHHNLDPVEKEKKQ